MKFKCIVEYEYPVEHKPPVKAELILHGDKVVTDNIKIFENRKTGHWIKTKVNYETAYSCSNCNRFAEEKSDYCPNCGANMRG